MAKPVKHYGKWRIRWTDETGVVATTLLRRRIVEYFSHGTGVKLTLVSGQIGFVLAGVISKFEDGPGQRGEGYARSTATVLDRQWSRD